MCKLVFFSCLTVSIALARGEPPVAYLAPQELLQSIGNAQADSYNNALQHSSYQHQQSGYGNAHTDIQIHKHIYVHVPPPDIEDEPMTPHVYHQEATKQKHFKIVFIKSPSAPAVRAPVVPPAPQNDEKTLIYVLHKKAEAQPDIVIPTPTPTKPSKPEVFYIKYKTKKDKARYGPPASYNLKDHKPASEYGVPKNENPNFSAINAEDFHTPSNVQDAGFNSVSAGGSSDYATNVEPSNHYLPSGTTLAPIVVADLEDQSNTMANSYGSRKRYFIKKRK